MAFCSLISSYEGSISSYDESNLTGSASFYSMTYRFSTNGWDYSEEIFGFSSRMLNPSLSNFCCNR